MHVPKPVGVGCIVKTDDRVEAEEWFKSDPFWTSGMRESFEILPGQKHFLMSR